MINNIQCDIVIPVYNASNDLKECVESLLKYTEKKHRIIIIDDCSPEKEVTQYLNSLGNIDNIKILKNETNMGFVGTVNKGMLFSNRDVILLNSDTILTQNWLEKLIMVAYSDQSIATVTPLTNNGTICSVPNFNEDNVIPEGYTIDSFSHFIERITLDVYPEIPTAVGFCMYIKRSVIDEVGVFDAKTFGKGYGEENDFCCRVREHGYKNVLADNTFVFHKGSMSFKEEKADLINKNLKILNERYPYYEKTIHDFVFLKNPLGIIHDNIKTRIPHFRDEYKFKGNVLVLVHNFFDEPYNHPIGGTEYHVKDIIENATSYNYYVLVSGEDELVLKHFQYGKLIEKYHFSLINPISTSHFHHEEYSNILENIILSFNINLLHIHHLIKHSFDAPMIAKKYGINVIFTLHDFYLFCPKVNLLDENNNYCIDIRSDDKCQGCLKLSHGFNTLFINKWKEKVRELFVNVDRFITPSFHTKEMFHKEYNLENIEVIEHGVSFTYLNEKTSINHQNIVKIGFIGGLSLSKGSKLIYELITKYKNEKIQWHLIGGIGDQRLNLLEQKNVIKHGEYSRNQLDQILQSINLDFVCLLSPWPETYSYTLSESWKNRLPVLVTPMGALKERVELVGGGWVSDNTNLKSIMSKIEDVLNSSPEELESVRDKIKEYNHKTIDIMANEYEQLYGKYVRNTAVNGRKPGFDNKYILNSLRYFAPSGHNIEQYNNEIMDLKNEIHLMKSTIGWKVLNKLRQKNNFVLKVGKKIIYIVLKYR